MSDIEWEHYPLVAEQTRAKAWLQFQADRGLADNTVQAYGSALEDYLRFCARLKVEAEMATRDHLARYIRDLNERMVPSPQAPTALKTGFSNATQRQRLTAVRLFYDYLVEEGQRETKPVGRGRYTPGKPTGGQRGAIPTYHRLPWIPTDEEWRTLLEATREAPIRTRFMLALGYDAGLRREELCLLETGDIDPARRLLSIRAQTTKNRRARVVPYSEATGALYAAYLHHRRTLSHERGRLLLSESRRNFGKPLAIWTWSKVIHDLAQRTALERFTTHTLRHLCLTDLARAGWDLHEIALFAGHRSTQTTLLYIHLSGRELAAKFQNGMAQLHHWRLTLMQELWP
ncbi:MAG TPA: integrase [Chloroflexi bacterium]|nr:integrase [Chloroflexota bacterium]